MHVLSVVETGDTPFLNLHPFPSCGLYGCTYPFLGFPKRSYQQKFRDLRVLATNQDRLAYTQASLKYLHR